MQLNGKIVAREDLTVAERDQMFHLMGDYYTNMDRTTFESDLAEKRWVILATDQETAQIRGFSTQTLVDVSHGGRRFRGLFSGDTIVHHDYWTRNPLAKLWGRLALLLIRREFAEPLYWFLITKGYKTYRFLPVFFHEFYPRHDLPTPRWARDLIDAFGHSKFPETYDPDSGIINMSLSGSFLKPGVADVSHGRLRDPDIRFFDARNPGHSRGDELCCIAPLTRENFTAAAYRVIGTDLDLVSVT